MKQALGISLFPVSDDYIKIFLKGKKVNIRAYTKRKNEYFYIILFYLENKIYFIIYKFIICENKRSKLNVILLDKNCVSTNAQ